MWHERAVQSGGEKNKTDRLKSEDKSLSAHPTSIWAPAAVNVKWIQHFPSHYHISLHWPDPIGSNQPANQPAPPLPPAFNWSYFLIPVIWKGSVISLLFLCLFVTRCLFDYTALNHFRCFSHSTNCHMCSIAPAAVYFIYCSAGELLLVMWGGGGGWGGGIRFINTWVSRPVSQDSHGSLTHSRAERLRARRDNDALKADTKKDQLCSNLNKPLVINKLSDPKASAGTR